MFEPAKIADYLIMESRDRGELLTNLKLQKLLYYAQAWFLANRDEPLFAENFQAWIHGPVLPSQYHRFKEYTWRPITEDIDAPELPEHVIEHLDEVLDVFGSESAIALEVMTHSEKPWQEARRGLAPDAPSCAIISQATMKAFYRSL